jgi:membrane protease subunit HflC
MPFIDKIYTIDSRIQINDIPTDKIQNSEQIYLVVDYYLKWKVIDFEKFFMINTSGGARNWQSAKRFAETLLRQKVNNAVIVEIGKRSIPELVSDNRQEIMDTFAAELNTSMNSLGLQLIDLNLKKVELPEEIYERVFNRMKTSRQKIAAKFRAEGKEEATVIIADTDAQKKILMAEAQKEALILQGQGESQAAALYNKSYAQDSDLFSYMKKMETYQATLNSKQDILLLNSNKELFSELHSTN